MKLYHVSYSYYSKILVKFVKSNKLLLKGLRTFIPLNSKISIQVLVMFQLANDSKPALTPKQWWPIYFSNDNARLILLVEC